MNHNKDITVKINNKEQVQQTNNWDSFPDKSNWHAEEAASIEKDNKTEEVNIIEKNNQSLDYSSIKKRESKKSVRSVFKVFLLTACSAIVIGGLFGIIILKMLVEVDNQDNLTSNVDISTDEVTTVDTSTKPSGDKLVKLEGMQAFVVQVGVFSSLEKAKEWQTKVKDTGYDAMIWDEGDQMRLFVGISSKEEDAKAIAADMEVGGVESYARAWSTTERSTEVETQATDWLKEFPSLWTQTVEAASGDSEANQIEAWNSWLAETPNDLAESSLAWKSSIEKTVEMLTNKESKTKIQLQLLEVWQLYQKI